MQITIDDEDEYFVPCTYPGVKPNTYKISNYGRVYSSITKTILTGYIDFKGYRRVTIKPDPTIDTRISKSFKIHRLVAWEFNGKPNDYQKLQPNHLDGIRDHNYYKNVSWTTASENVRHSFIHGNRKNKSGEDHYRTKISNAFVAKIKYMLFKEKLPDWYVLEKCMAMSETDGLSEKYINNVIKYVRKQGWKNVN